MCHGREALGGIGPNLIQSSLTRQDEKGISSASILATAGHLLFTADASGNLLALDPSNGQVLWHSRPGGVLNDAAPMAYQIDGIQYVLTGVDGVMYVWTG